MSCSPIAHAFASQKPAPNKRKKSAGTADSRSNNKRGKSSRDDLSVINHRCFQNGTLELLVAHRDGTPDTWSDPSDVYERDRDGVVGYVAQHKAIAKLLSRVPQLEKDLQIANFASSFAKSNGMIVEESHNVELVPASDVRCCICCCFPWACLFWHGLLKWLSPFFSPTTMNLCISIAASGGGQLLRE